MITLLVCASVLLSPMPTTKQPKWLDSSIAGYTFDYDNTHGQAAVFDKALGYYLVRNIECDGSHLNLILTRDRKLVSQYGVKIPGFGDEGCGSLSNKPLRDLKTGLGIAIGQSPDEIEKRLGKPTKKNLTGSKNQFQNYIYFWRDVQKGEGYEYKQTYTFKQNKLIEIFFNREAVPGC